MKLIFKDPSGNKVAEIANGSANNILTQLHTIKSKYQPSVNDDNEVVFTVKIELAEIPNGSDVTIYLPQDSTITCKN